MKNILKFVIAFTLFTFTVTFFTSCTSCSGSNSSNQLNDAGLQTDASAPALDSSDALSPAPQQEVIIGDTWAITVPYGADKTINLQQDIVFSAFLEDETSFAITLSKQPYSDTYESYLIYSVRSFKASSLEILSSIPVKNRNLQYMNYLLLKDGVKVWSWVAVKNNYGYSLSCGGLSEDQPLQDLCSEVFDSLELY